MPRALEQPVADRVGAVTARATGIVGTRWFGSDAPRWISEMLCQPSMHAGRWSIARREGHDP